MAGDPLRTVPADQTLDAEAFRREIVGGCAPVVIRGLVADWPVTRAARAEGGLLGYLAAMATQTPINIFVGPPEISGRYYYNDELTGFNFTEENLPFAQALERVLRPVGEGQARGYLGSVPTPGYAPAFAAENPMPLLDAQVAPRLWLGHAAQVACHYDTMDNLACVVAGERRFTLYPPETIADLYVGPIDLTMAGQPVSLAASSRPDPQRWPRFEQVRHLGVEVELGPGDALYLPKLWWHMVASSSPVNGMVNYWWDAFAAGPDGPYTSLMLALISISERPPAERAAWRAFFDHYVFRPDGHPLAHLPPELHGLLGPLQPDNYGRIRARILNTLKRG
jgi:hypothetical protein